MRTYVTLKEYGETPTDAIDHHLELTTSDEVLRPGPGEVHVKIESASVGWVDLIMSSGQYQHMVAPPYTPGLEYAGTVIACGPEVTRFRAGDRVLSDGLLTGPRSLGAHQRYGGWATDALAPESALHPVPTGWSFDEACQLLGNYETAYHCLIRRGHLREGETVLVLGASGQTGLAALQVAKLMRAKTIAVGRASPKLAELARIADHVVASTDESGEARSIKDDVKALTEGRGVDVVYDAVGGPLSIEAMKACTFGARFVIVGWAATPFVAKGKGGRGSDNVNHLPTNLIMMKGLDVLGAPTVISTLRDPSLRRERLAAIFGWAEEGAIRPTVSHRFPLSEIREAMRAKWRGDVLGGCVVHPQSFSETT